MPQAKYTGNPMGGGNPPGEHSYSYTTPADGSGEGNFNKKSSYRGDMNVGIKESAPVVGNQPKQTKTSTVNSKANGPALR